MTTLPAGHMPVALYGVAAIVAVALLLTIAYARRAHARAGTGTGRLETIGTLIAAGIATAVTASGMWKFFGDVLQVHNPLLRAALFTFLETAMFVSALRARRNLLDDLARITERRTAAEHILSTSDNPDTRATAATDLKTLTSANGSTGIDGKAVWVLAILSGFLASTDAHRPGEVALRFIAPLTAAWLWERGLAAHRRRAADWTRQIHWRLTPERVLVFLGLAEPAGRSVDEVDQERRLAKLARLAFRLHTARATGAWKWRINALTRKFLRQVEKANERLALATNPAMRAAMRAYVASLFQVIDGTAPSAVADLTPWAPGTGQAGGSSRAGTGHMPEMPAVTGSGHQQPGTGQAVERAAPPAGTTGHRAGNTQRAATGHRAPDAIVDLTARRAARTGQGNEVPVEALADTLGQHFPGRAVGRPTALPVLRQVHGSCSKDRADAAKDIHNARIRIRQEVTG